MFSLQLDPESILSCAVALVYSGIYRIGNSVLIVEPTLGICITGARRGQKAEGSAFKSDIVRNSGGMSTSTVISSVDGRRSTSVIRANIAPVVGLLTGCEYTDRRRCGKKYANDSFLFHFFDGGYRLYGKGCLYYGPDDA